jgi:integrase
MIPELLETIEQQLRATRALEVASGRLIPWLFHNAGNPIVDYRPAWHKACAAAGLIGRIPHDFRRTAARNLINAEVDPLTTMQLVGWEDIGMLKRYNIIGDETLKRGTAKLNSYIDEQKRRKQKVVAAGWAR